MAESIGPGDEVITTPYTFFATAGASPASGPSRSSSTSIRRPTTWTCPARRRRSPAKTRAIIPVHLYGQMADMDAVMDVANQHGLVVIEDAAQAIGAEYKGQRAGSIGTMAVSRSSPRRTSAGRATAAWSSPTTRSARRSCAVLRGHGSKPKYYHKLSAATSAWTRSRRPWSAKLPHLDGWTAAASTTRSAMTSSSCGQAAGRSARSAGRSPYLQPVCDPQSRRDDLQAHLRKERGRHRSLLSGSAASAGMLRLSGLQGRRLSGKRTRREGDAGAAHLSRTDGRAGRVRGRLHPRVLRQGSPGAGRRRLQLDAELRA